MIIENFLIKCYHVIVNVGFYIKKGCRMVMKYKMIASDLDGTLNDRNYIITEGNVQAIKKAMDSGIKVVLCSGRSPVSLLFYAKKIGLDQSGCYGIGFNGGSVYEAETGKILYETRLDRDLAVEIIKDIKNVSSDVKMSMYLEDDYIIAERDLQILEEHNNEGVMRIEKVEKLEDLSQDVIKIMLVDKRDKLDFIYNEIKDHINGRYTMVFTGQNILEFLPVNINKAEGIKRLIKHLNITLDEVVTFGDNYNDIEMIQEAGFGIAIANAVEPLKQAADYVTKRDNNDDAMIEVVDMILGID